MKNPHRIPLSQTTETILSQFAANAELVRFVAKDGPLENEIRSFLAFVADALKNDCHIRDWRQQFPADPDGYIWFQLYPEGWQLPKVGPVGICVCWGNPFAVEPEDLYVGLRIPWNWSNAKDLKETVAPHVPEGFTDVSDAEVDQNDAYWRYLRFQDFSVDSQFDVDGFYNAILTAVRDLLTLRPTIDAYLSICPRAAEPRTARRKLGIVAIVDTETAGSEQELIEIAIVNAVYDKQSGEVLGIVEQYEGLREPKCRMSRADQRLNGLGIQEIRGHSLDEKRIKALLQRADFVVAHNAPFDKARVSEQFKWATELDWRDSLNQVSWGTDTRGLQTLLEHHGVECGVQHRAGSDARALLELLSYRTSGGTYFAQLLTKSEAAMA